MNPAKHYAKIAHLRKVRDHHESLLDELSFKQKQLSKINLELQRHKKKTQELSKGELLQARNLERSLELAITNIESQIKNLESEEGTLSHIQNKVRLLETFINS